MTAVDKVDIVQVAFAVSLVVAGIALVAAALDRLRSACCGASRLPSASAHLRTVVFALDPKTALAVAGAGLKASLLAAVAAIGVRRGVEHSRRVEAEIERAENRLARSIARGADERSAEVDRVLARARAESLSLIADEERRIVESRRTVIAEREQAAAHS
jgi:hypothetical protein